MQAIADCGGEGRVLSCGYQTASSSAELANVIVQSVGPGTVRATFSAFLQRTAGEGSVAGARIQAMAVCLA